MRKRRDWGDRKGGVVPAREKIAEMHRKRKRKRKVHPSQGTSVGRDEETGQAQARGGRN